MTTCTVEAINAAWTALAFLSGAAAVAFAGIGWRKWVGKPDDKVAVTGLTLAAAVALSTGFHAYGQDSLRYVAADMADAKCLYDNNGNVTVVGICPAAESEPPYTKGEK